MSTKVCVDVHVSFDSEGNMHPTELTWEDVTLYSIDKVLDIRPAAPMKAGVQGDRFTIKVSGNQSFLFFERNTSIVAANLGRWFVERKDA